MRNCHMVVYTKTDGVTINVDGVRLRYRLHDDRPNQLVPSSAKEVVKMRAALKGRPDLMQILRLIVAHVDEADPPALLAAVPNGVAP